MREVIKVSGSPRSDYGLLQRQLAALTSDEADPLANAANFVSLLYYGLTDLNWAGIYVFRGDELVLGPFQGRSACVRIPLGQGVCGTAMQQRRTLRVADVHEFSGHIACDPDSASELVVPLLAGKRALGVVDLDSPRLNRFDARDEAGVESLCLSFVQVIERNGGGFI